MRTPKPPRPRRSLGLRVSMLLKAALMPRRASRLDPNAMSDHLLRDVGVVRPSARYENGQEPRL